MAETSEIINTVQNYLTIFKQIFFGYKIDNNFRVVPSNVSVTYNFYISSIECQMFIMKFFSKLSFIVKYCASDLKSSRVYNLKAFFNLLFFNF